MGVLPESRPDMYHRSVPIVIENDEEEAPEEKVAKTMKEKKVEVLESIRSSVIPLKQRIGEVDGCFEDKEYLYLQDKLEKAHIDLDNVEADGDDEIRKMRKSVVVFVSEVLKILDSKAKHADEESVDNGSTKCEDIDKKIEQGTNKSDDSNNLETDCNHNLHEVKNPKEKEVKSVKSDSTKNESPNHLKINSNIRIIPIIKVAHHSNEFETMEVQKHDEANKEVSQEKSISDTTENQKKVPQEKSLNDTSEANNEVMQQKSNQDTIENNSKVAQEKSVNDTSKSNDKVAQDNTFNDPIETKMDETKTKFPTSPCDMRVIPVLKIDKLSSEFDTKQVITDNSRVQMKVLDNCVNLVVHVKDFVNDDIDDLKVGFDEGDIIVIGRNGDETVVVTKTVPSDCVPDKAVSQLNTDGILIVKVPRRRRNLQPKQMGRHQFKF